MSKYPLSFEEFKRIYSKVPRLTVEVVARVGRGIVLTKRDVEPHKGKWHIPGGTVYFRENLGQAVGRVAMQELGIEVEIEKNLGWIEYPRNEGFDWPIGMVFGCQIKSGKLRGSEQGEEVRIFERLPKNMIIDQREWLLRNLRWWS